MGVPGMSLTAVDRRDLPGIVIFVHGVNSDGEWFEAAEEGLLRGLNTRLGLDRALGGNAALQPVRYLSEIQPNGQLTRSWSSYDLISDPGFSPVIRFRWGYKAAGKDGTPGSQDEKAVYGGKLYLNELDAWGGGPFQNGTSALSYMWGLGLDDRVFWWLYANMFPVDGREVYACPPRTYFAHAAHRLKELIKAIRDKQADCPITVVCHSQGNMVTLAAALLGEKEGAIADTYVLCNPPYSLESLTMDQIVNEDAQGATGQFGSVTTQARQATFANFLHAVRQRAGQGQTQELINRYMGFTHPTSGEKIFALSNFPSDPKTPLPSGQDRDNRGRVFLYCNPHDQVIGVSPVQGIGWKGVSQQQLDAIGADGVFHIRVWAAPGGNQSPSFAVGAAEWTGRPYRYLADNHVPDRFWNPPAPAMRFSLATNPSQGFFSQILTLVSAPIIYIVTRLFTLPINDDPSKEWAVPITAPVLSQPVVPQSRRYGQLGPFDEGKDPSKDALAAPGSDGKLNDDAYGGVYQSGGIGDAQTEASLRYEHEARLRRLQRAAEHEGRKLSDEDQRTAVKRMLEENPNATDHSTILTNPAHAEKALAYDVAIGWLNPSKITAEDLSNFRRFAHWMAVDQFLADDFPPAQPFVEYWTKGFYSGLQLQHTYDMAHMAANAPGIQDERVRSLFGAIKG